MTSDYEGPKRRKLKVAMDDLELAFDDASGETNYYLDLATGQVSAITGEISRGLEEIYEELPEEEGELDAAFEAALQGRSLPDWQKDELREAHRVEPGYAEHFVSVPKADSGEAYRDMENFIATVEDAPLQGLLELAINGRGAFRRFKDVLARYPREEERWFRFKAESLRRRIAEWLDEEGVEPVWS